MRESLAVQFYTDSTGEWRWRARTANGKIVATSGEGYQHRTDCEEIARRLFPIEAALGNAPAEVYSFAVTFGYDPDPKP